tara:strand:+ start:1485 stop:2480 length:996 start_codon:yes stop_codon:yes gene_type:complete
MNTTHADCDPLLSEALSGAQEGISQNVKLKVDTLLLSGGAMKCISILGSLQYLFEKEIIKPDFEGIKEIYFVSGSSVYLTPLLIGMPMEATIDLFKKIDYHGIVKKSNDMKIQNLFNNFGLMKITDFKFIMNAIFKGKGIDENITLKDFYELTKIKINFRVVNITKVITEYLNKDNSPDLKYIDAVCMTSCIPLLFEPIEYNGCKYVDGGVNNNFPYEMMNGNNYLGINILSCEISLDKDDNLSTHKEAIDRPEVSDISEYLYLIYNIYGTHPIEKSSIQHIKILIEGPGFNFKKYSSNMKDTILVGYKTTEAHFANFQTQTDPILSKNED